jgi:tRNA-2-methylthio-N6-dimethylallyladenosine synthase
LEELYQISHNAHSQVDKSREEERKKVYIRTFGCQMNEYDSLKLAKILDGNYQTTNKAENADLILINTCSVRDKPEQKLYSLLGQIQDFKRTKPELMVGVGGCVAQQEGQNIIRRSKLVDFVFGTHNLSLVPSLISRRQEGAPPQVAIDYRDEWEEIPAGFVESDRVSVFVSISRGCNKNCTYCIVPTTRGPEVSRPLSEIEKEIRIAVHRGAKEVVLLGQTVNSYGLDLQPRMRFSQLIDKISAIDGVKRIRFTSPHPQEVRSDFIEQIASNSKICRHIHMPLQSGSNRILKLMNRNYKRERYLEIIESLKEKAPDIAITTDIIVGFPGETEQDFLDTLDVIDIVQFDSSYSFMFSPRPGTKAALMSEDIDANEKLRRLQVLQSKQSEISEQRLNAWVGKTTEILLDGPSSLNKDCLQGRLSQNIVVNLTKEYSQLKAGDIVTVKITASARNTLKAEILAN